MRQEIKNWWEQAEIDLKNAEMNLKNDAYYLCVFLCQQAIEKGLKAFFMLKKKESPGMTHSLIYLATETAVPKIFFDFLARLTPEFVSTRYPDMSDDIPARLYTKGLAAEILTKAKELMLWLKDQMMKR